MNNILAGLRIVEGSAFVAAPSAGMTLAQLGADVIRFDIIGGGIDHRRWPVTREGKSLYWAGLNKGKRSIAVDFREPEGRELLTELITRPGRDGGIFLTNFPMKGWLAYESLKRRREDLIMLVMTGNPDGSSEVDYTVNCATGLPMMTGPEEGGGPVNHVLPAWDLITGLTAATGLLAAERHRRETGEGQLIKLALSDVAFAAMGHLGFIGEFQVNGEERRGSGNDLYGAFGRDFPTKDGRRVMIVAVTLRQWRALVELTGLEDAIRGIEAEHGLNFDEEGDRFLARKDLNRVIGKWCAERSLSDIQSDFEDSGVCWGNYRSVSEMIRNDNRVSPMNPMFEEVDHPGIGRFLAPGSALDFGAAPRESVRPSPVLGEHTDEILAEDLGLSAAEIAGLHERGIVAGPVND